MYLKTFQVINCFGFQDSGEIKFESPKRFYYIIGRNSSGKTSLLTALKYSELNEIPKEAPNFLNFNKNNIEPKLISSFIVNHNDLNIKKYINSIKDFFVEKGLTIDIINEEQKLTDLFNVLTDEYSKLIDVVKLNKIVFVVKDSEGDYKFLSKKNNYDLYKTRKESISNILSKTFDANGNLNLVNRSLNFKINSNYFENSLFSQFPQIYLFDEEYDLKENLPDRITEEDINKNSNSLQTSFIDLIGKEELKTYFNSNDPDVFKKIQKSFQKIINELCKEINNYKKGKKTNIDFLEINVDHKDGLQLTIKTDGKKSFYSHLSDNTKFLFSYFLYKKVHKIKNAILLFDEPNNGFHSSAQSFLLNFLKSLSKDNNLVVVSTHSEYLIDPTMLQSFKVMGVDTNNSLYVHNKISTKKGRNESLALQPLLDAIGLKHINSLIVNDKVIITEGFLDYIYLYTFNDYLFSNRIFSIAPCKGDSQIINILPFFISQGIRFKILLDTGNSKKIIKATYYFDDKYIWEVPIPEKYKGKFKGSGIEDLFSKEDYKMLIKEFCDPFNEKEFLNVPNSIFVKNKPLKKLAANYFSDNFDILKKSFNEETKTNFHKALIFCKNNVWAKF